MKLVAIIGFVVFLFHSACASSKTREPIPSASDHASARSSLAAETIPTDPPGKRITTFGEHRIGNTIVEANETERKLTVKHLSSKEFGGGKSTGSSAVSLPADEWPLHEGWFAYVEQNGAHVWLHNGAGGLVLVERKETAARNFTNTYGTNHFPMPIPVAVLNHLNEPLRSKLSRN